MSRNLRIANRKEVNSVYSIRVSVLRVDDISRGNDTRLSSHDNFHFSEVECSRCLALDTLTLKTYLLFEDAQGCRLQLLDKWINAVATLTSLSWDGIATGIELFGGEVSANIGSALRAGASSRALAPRRAAPRRILLFTRNSARKCLPVSLPQYRAIVVARQDIARNREDCDGTCRRALYRRICRVTPRRDICRARHTRLQRGKSLFLARGQKIRAERQKSVRSEQHASHSSRSTIFSLIINVDM